MTTITEAEILSAIAQSRTVADRPAGVFTVAEIAAASGRSIRLIRRDFRQLIASGRLQATTITVTSIDGRLCPAPAYRLLPTAKRKAA